MFSEFGISWISLSLFLKPIKIPKIISPIAAIKEKQPKINVVTQLSYKYLLVIESGWLS